MLSVSQRRLGPLLTVGVLLLLLTPRQTLAKRLAVLELAGSGVNAEGRAYLTDLVRGKALEHLGTGWEVITRENMLALIDANQGQCLEEGTCEVETFRNIGADLGVAGKVILLGSKLRLNLALYDVTAGKLLRTANVVGADADELVAALPGACQTLYTKLPIDAEKTKAQATTAAPPAEKRAAKPAGRPASPAPAASTTRFRFQTNEPEHQFDVELMGADGRSQRCKEQVKRGSPCLLGEITLGETIFNAHAKGLASMTDDIDADDASEMLVISLREAPSVGSILAWTFGGLSLASGVSMLPLGLALDMDGFIVSGALSIIAGGGMIAMGFAFDGRVEYRSTTLALEGAGKQDTAPARAVIVPTPSGVAVVGSFR